MQATIEQSALASSVSLVQGLAQTKLANPTVENLILKVSEDQAEILGTNLMISTRIRMACTNTEPGEVAIPAKLAAQAIRELPDGPVTLVQEGNEIAITAGRSALRLVAISTDDFPPFFPSVEGEAIEFPAAMLKKSFERTVFSTSDERSRFELNGVYLNCSEGTATWVATDGRRLSRVVQEVGDLPDCRILIPARAVQEVIRAIPDEGDVSITFGGKRILFDMGDVTLSSTLLEDNFPPYQSLLPDGYPLQIRLSRDDLQAAVRRASVLANEKTRLVELRVQEAYIDVHGERQEAGEASTSLDAVIEGELPAGGFRVSYNADYMLECFRAMGPGDVVWGQAKPGGPAYLFQAGDESFLHIIMPMTVRQKKDEDEKESDDSSAEV